MLRYYLSTDRTITTMDTQLVTVAVGELAPGASSAESVLVSIPNVGSYWVGACVDTVDGEIETGNNCSAGLPVTVAMPADNNSITILPAIIDLLLEP